MSLHDVSKDDNTRLNPKANSSDTRAQRDATNTTSIHPVTDATTTKGYLQTGSGRIVGNDGSNNVGLFGFDSTGTMVVKVAKPGFDADTAIASNLVFNSAQNVFKIVSSGTTTITTANLTKSAVGVYNNVTVTTTIPHGLGYIPIAIVVYTDGVTYFPTSTNGSSLTSSGASYGYARVDWSTDATNLYLNASTALWILSAGSVTLPGNTFTVKYYLLQETAN